ncbi:MAG: polyphosphate kinase 1 [Phycisphaeraceae bacterium]
MNDVLATIRPSPPTDQPAEFLNRDLSWLEFNRRVLHEALDERTPLLERVAFLSIFSSNLDEFFQKRVGNLKRQAAAGITVPSPDGLSAREQLTRVRNCIMEMLRIQRDCYANTIRASLTDHGVYLLSWDELTDEDRAFAQQYYQQNLFAILTPLAVDPGHPFPFISNLSMSLGIILRHPPAEMHSEGNVFRLADDADASMGEGEIHFARVKVPHLLPQWVRLGGSKGDSGPFRFVKLRDLIQYNLDDLFPGMIIEQVMPFRVTRNADAEKDEEESDDLLESVEQELRDRKFAKAVRLDIGLNPNPQMIELLKEELALDDDDVYHMPDVLDYTTLLAIHELNLPQIKFEPWTPTMPPRLADDDADIFSIIRAGDVMVHHPYESFNASVERFIRAAVKDPKVMAIKLTLYRTGAHSPFIAELIRAAEAGKQVVALVELKARFDEERNIQVAQTLEKAGVHVVYGVMGLKTHTKITVVVRQESEGMRTYAHIGTGNYNPKTASLYTDLGLFTCNTAITGELIELFHFLTGRSRKRDFKTLLIAPINMRARFMELIDREIEHTDAWKERGANPNDPLRPMIIAKMNSLEDKKVCQKLYEASQCGVRIKLIVRGFCCLRPGVPVLSDNITVMSVIGRFLEHSRIYYFHNQGKGEYYIGSADWMYRNLNTRVEAITPITDPAMHARLKAILEVMLNDQRQAWDMMSDGRYIQRQPDPEKPESRLGTHKYLMDMAKREASRL